MSSWRRKDSFKKKVQFVKISYHESWRKLNMITTPSPGSVLNRKVPEKVSSSVKEAAIQTGVARPEHRYSSLYRV